jgi:hypothetical protein
MMAWDPEFGSGVAERKPRQSFLFKVECENADGQIVLVRVRNLSETGLGGVVEKGLSFVDGETVKIMFRGQRMVSGKIIWVRNKGFGVTFDRIVDPKEILDAIHGAQPSFEVDDMHKVEDRCWRPATLAPEKD